MAMAFGSWQVLLGGFFGVSPMPIGVQPECEFDDIFLMIYFPSVFSSFFGVAIKADQN